MALLHPKVVTPPEACGLSPDARRILPSPAVFFSPPVVFELFGRRPSLIGVDGCPFSFVASADDRVLNPLLGPNIERGIPDADLLPTPLLGGDPTPSFLLAPSSLTGVRPLARFR